LTVGFAPTPDQRAAVLAEVARKRVSWAPSKEAWSQLRDLVQFIDRRVRLQFWDNIMYLLENEGPYPMLSDCRGIVLLRQARLDRIEELPNSSGYSPAKFLHSEKMSGLTLGPIAELLEIATIG
jgi:hypothetical protein